MNFNELKKMIEIDLQFKEDQLDTESLKIPQIHSKYLNFLTDEKLKLQTFKFQHDTLYRLKWEYYNGKISAEELEKQGWEQFDLKLLKQDIPIYLNSDEDLKSLNEKIFFQKEKIAYLDSIIKMIMNRQFHIRDAIAWRKFINGVI